MLRRRHGRAMRPVDLHARHQGNRSISASPPILADHSSQANAYGADDSPARQCSALMRCASSS